MQKLGLKEYEAEAFIALTQIPNGTAREVSNVSEVPRTRVYDAVESLEAKGLVEIQHTNPKQFRAVSIDEAVNTLRAEYESRTASLRATLKDVRPIDRETEQEVPQKVWSLSGQSAITSRVVQLIEECKAEILLFVGGESGLTQQVVDALTDALDRGDVSAYIGVLTDELRSQIERRVPKATVFTSQLGWMQSPAGTDDQTTISKLLLVDKGNILVSTLDESTSSSDQRETAVFGQGFDNGFVTVVRRIISTGAVPVPANSSVGN